MTTTARPPTAPTAPTDPAARPARAPLPPLEGVRARVFRDRYSLKDAEGQPTETGPEEMWDRVAAGIAATETDEPRRRRWGARYRDLLQDFKFVPAGRILTGAGTGHAVTYYNCFVLPSPEDSRGGIIDNFKLMVEIEARGGGVGVNLSSLRPRGTYVKGVNGTSSGPMAWAGLYAYATNDVIQQGGTRRGALMLMLDDSHPDVFEFVTVKQDLSKLNGANLSVCVSDGLMAAVKADGPWDLHWGGRVYRTVRARELWDTICQSAWQSGEPGLVFLERYQKQSNTAYCETIVSVNPCGEQGLPAWGVCNLGAMNLAAYAVGPTGSAVFDYAALARDVPVAIRFLDSVIEATEYFFPENEAAQRAVRRTGLGTMGLADALIRLGIRYGSDRADAVIGDIYGLLRDAAYEASALLAAEKGAFPWYDADRYLERPFVRSLALGVQETIRMCGIRNAVILTQAPTGTTSLLSGVSSGIEPVYDFAMVRRDRTGEHVITHPLLADWQAAHPGQATPEYFVSANDLSPEEHVRTQARIQQYTDSSISKTVNAPNDHTVEQVQELYLKAYDYGCKGVTYFRDGCREGVLSHLPASAVVPGAAVAVVEVVPPMTQRQLCPECGEPTLVEEEGCAKCHACGYAACAV